MAPGPRHGPAPLWLRREDIVLGRIAIKKQILSANPLTSKTTRVDGQSWYAKQAR